MEDPAVTNFRNYIRINTVQPSPDYVSCTKFLEEQAKELDADCQVIECVPGKPIVVMTLLGQNPNLPSLLLNSHTDVVPVFPDQWKYDPFSAHKDENGDIYGRGTQDMKCVGIQYLEALKYLKKEGHQFLRTIHISFMPDEEIGGVGGMKKFVESAAFKKMNVGFGLDEGYANPTENFTVFYGERGVWWMKIKCPGQPGHGSQFLPNTAGAKLKKVIDSFLNYRDQQENLLKENQDLSLGDVTSVNLTMLEGGVQYNVVPSELNVGFDIRIAPTEDFTKLEEKIKSWCKGAGDDVTYEFVPSKGTPEDGKMLITCIDDGKNPWWNAFSQACKDEGVNLVKEIFPAGTDSRFLRELGIPALGFSPMNRTPILLHDHNEFLNEKIFLRGIEIYRTIIPALANLKI
ncbi:aminoacylase-1 [Procambarus clarkii]|uniref:aminoacylase-1 n=1 Tax=Procambarus clarkii TaxID=6728 RepID=UPI001E6785F6|nr:aminoacylase-1-like [Procambarus clarkii]